MKPAHQSCWRPGKKDVNREQNYMPPQSQGSCKRWKKALEIISNALLAQRAVGNQEGLPGPAGWGDLSQANK